MSDKYTTPNLWLAATLSAKGILRTGHHWRENRKGKPQLVFEFANTETCAEIIDRWEKGWMIEVDSRTLMEIRESLLEVVHKPPQTEQKDEEPKPIGFEPSFAVNPALFEAIPGQAAAKNDS